MNLRNILNGEYTKVSLRLLQILSSIMYKSIIVGIAVVYLIKENNCITSPVKQ